jgi:hypothetical protein
MKSMSKVKFTLEDFEKGLMLAGFISPQNEAEVSEREILEKHETNLKKEKGKTYFKRTVLAAELINQLHSESTFGRVKFQKMIFLCEHASNMNIENRYAKFAAGPFDNKFMHSINRELKKQKWFDVKVVKSNGYSKPIYSELDKLDNYKSYYKSYFDEYDESIQYLISLLKKEKTHFVELIATVYACWHEIITKKQEFTDENMFGLFYSWADEKKKFTKDEVRTAIKWMKVKGISPISKE